MNLSVMIKPASNSCNLRCTYCFYHSLSGMRESAFRGMMSYELIDDIIDKALTYVGDDRLYMSFQGGEPLLRGKEFFIRVGEKLSNRPNTHLVIQTNGTLIDSEWCTIFKKYKYLIGVSLDGDRENNSCRVDTKGELSFDDVMIGIMNLKTHNVPFNVLTVLSKNVVLNIEKIYDFYKTEGYRFLQFIPCLKPLNGEAYDANSYPTEDEYCRFLIRLFNRYLRDIIKGEYVSIRQFDNFVRLAQGNNAEQCGMNGVCSQQFVIEGDGSVYPCDFYCLDEYCLGNIKDENFLSLSKKQIAKDFINESLVIQEKCKNCDFYKLCKGGCKRESIDVEKCSAYKKFFAYALPHLRRIR